MDRAETPRGRGPRIAAGIAIVGLVAHFGLTIMHVGPISPLSQQLAPVTNAWINPFFNQNWELFAPDPVNTDMGLLVQARGPDVADEEAWVDISTPLLERKLHNPLPDHLHYVVTGSAHNFVAARQEVIDHPSVADQFPEAEPFAAALPEDVLAAAPEDLRGAYDFTLDSLMSTAARSWSEQMGQEPTEVKIRLVTHTFPRWSERADPGIGEVVYSDLPWSSVATVGADS